MRVFQLEFFQSFFLRAFFFLTDEILNLKSLNPLNEKKSFLFYFFTRKRIQSYLE